MNFLLGLAPLADKHECARALAKIPALDVAQVVHARWIHDINNLYGCSKCMTRETMSHKKLKQFCPNCGARMDGEAE